MEKLIISTNFIAIENYFLGIIRFEHILQFNVPRVDLSMVQEV